MKRPWTFTQVLLAFVYFSCQEKPLRQYNPWYFDKRELSDDERTDSLRNKHYGNKLMLFEEPSLKDTSNQNETIRLTAFPSIYSAYCIRLDKIDSVYIVSYKMDSDPKDLRRTGLNGLTLDYKSDFGKMDTLYHELMKRVNVFDIFTQNNSTPETIIQKGIVGADGTDFLLEYYKEGRHIALVRRNGFLRENFYKKSGEFMDIVNNMNSLVPAGLLPNLETAIEIEDVRFPVFKKSNK